MHADRYDASSMRLTKREGWQGWDDVRAVLRLGERADARPARRAVLAARGARGATGRSSSSAAAPAGSRCRSRAPACRLVGIDRSAPMLGARAAAGAPHGGSPTRQIDRLPSRSRPRRHPRAAVRPTAPSRMVHRAVRHPAVADSADRDLTATLASVARVLEPGGTFGHRSRAGRAELARIHEPRAAAGPAGRGAHLTLIESVRQDRAPPAHHVRAALRGAARRRARREHRFELTFRTLSVPQMTRRLERAGFVVDARPRRLPRRAVGRARGRLDHPREKECRISPA